MKKRTWIKLVALLLLIGGIVVGLYVSWGPIWRGSSAAWGRGHPALVERTYYSSRIRRVIDIWEQTSRAAETEEDGRFRDSYMTLLVIDLDKEAIWIEEDGEVQKNDFAELPSGLEWKLHHVTSQADTELSGRVILKMRGAYSGQQTWEYFDLIGTGRGSGYCKFRFHSKGGSGDYYSGPFRPQPYEAGHSKKTENAYGSLLVTDAEYDQHRADSGTPTAQAGNWLEENKASWLRAEKSLYSQIERHLRAAGYQLRALKVKPGPDFSAGHAKIEAISYAPNRLFSDPSSTNVHLKFDYLGDDVWYAKGGTRRLMALSAQQRTLNLELLVHPTSQITGSQRSGLLAEGRKMYEFFSRLRSSGWEATFANGLPVELIGICEHPSAGKQWWGPDGSPLDHEPYITTELCNQPGSGKKLYEIAWRAPIGVGGYTCSIEGDLGSHSRDVRTRYGYRGPGSLFARAHSFDDTQRKTTMRVKFSDGGWQTALVVKDKPGETKFLDRQRIILYPPSIENGRIVVRCFEETAAEVEGYETLFIIKVAKDGPVKTILLDSYEREVTYNQESGLTEHKFT